MLRIIALSIVLSAAAAGALWYSVRPSPPKAVDEATPWQTPPLDVALWENRLVLEKARHGLLNTLDGRWIGDACHRQPDSPRSAVFLLGRQETEWPQRAAKASRILVQLWPDSGRITIDQFESNRGPKIGHRVIDLNTADVEAFNRLVREGGYAEMAPTSRLSVMCDPGREQVLQSCIDGRYYAVFRHCDHGDSIPDLTSLGERIDEFLAARTRK